MDRKKLIEANQRALELAGLSEEARNVPLGRESSRTKSAESPESALAGFAASPNPRLAAAARKRQKELENLPPPRNPAALELPEETPPLGEQSEEERRRNAVDLTYDLPTVMDGFEYGQ